MADGAAGGAGVTSTAAATHAGAATKSVQLVVAATTTGGIGRNGTLPWNLPTDMAFFKAVTTGDVASTGKRNAVIMGRKTWSSIPPRFRPLKDRVNVVLSRTPSVRGEEGLPEDVLVATSLQAAVAMLSAPPYGDTVGTLFVIGGAAAFQEAMSDESAVVADIIHLTRIYTPMDTDVAIPALSDAIYALTEFKPRQVENGVEFQFCTYKRRDVFGLARSCAPSSLWYQAMAMGMGGAKRHEEYQYLDAIRDILATGVERSDRTGVGTVSKFGLQMRFSLRNNVLPLLTTKKVFWRGVAEELLWFISGGTAASALQEKGIHIWDGNGSREFLDKTGLAHREVGDLGPVYGFQWRHFGAAYTDMHADYTGAGVDQLAEVIHKLKTNPMDRRIILTAWNPAALKDMALPPCHMFAQFYVSDGELSCQMYQRSGDMGLGVPFNIASYALLTRLLAQTAGLKPGEFVHVLGDAHVYKNHVEPLMLQLEREPKPFPKLFIDSSIHDINAFRYEHFTVEGYECHPPIKMDMAV